MMLRNLIFAFRRLRPYVVLRLRYFPCALLALGEAILHCWPLLLLAFLAPLVLALSSQGRQALLAAGSGLGLGMLFLFWLGTILTAIYARLILDSAPSNARPRRARRFAEHCAPQLVAVATSFAIPLLLRYATNIDFDPTADQDAQSTFLGFIFIFMFMGPMAAIGVPAMVFQDGRYRLNDDEIGPLMLIGIVYAVALVVVDFRSVLTLFLVLMVTVIFVEWFAPLGFLQPRTLQRTRLKFLGWIAFMYALVVLWLAARIAVDPVDRASWWGPTDVVLIAMLAYLCIGFLIDWGLWWLAWLRCSKENPLLLSALRLAVLAAIALRLLSGSFGDAELRTIAPKEDKPAQAVSAYLDQWIAQRQSQASGLRPYSVFIVTAEGGGIRAAYWTATLLAALQDRHPDFANHVLALSGVSGGSVGASIFAALISGSSHEAALPCRSAGGYEACARAVGRGDLLSPPLASMLLAEPLHRLTGAFGDADRALALERGLERAWQDVMNNARFAEPFANLAASAMLLLPNATSAGSGQRIVISTLQTDRVFDRAYTLDGRPLALSTATLLSARFPAISPASVYQQAPGRRMRIVDGGFSDNSGAATGADVLDALGAALDRAKAREKFRPVVIAITNGEQLVDAGSARGGLRSLTLGALLDPVETLDSVRGSLSTRYQADLRSRVIAQGGVYLENMRLIHGKADLPLGWMLASAAADVMDERLFDLQAAAKGDFQCVDALLAGGE